MGLSVEDRLDYHATHRKRIFSSSGRMASKRLKEIELNINFEGKTVLDLGCSGGYFSFNLAKTAKQVLGVDGDKEVIDQNILQVQQKNIDNIKFIHSRITSDFLLTLEKYDVVIFLSVFHHMLAASDAYGWNTEDSRNTAIKTLSDIRNRANIMVFEMGRSDEQYDWSSKLPKMLPDPVSWVINNVFGEEFEVKVIQPPVLRGFLGIIRYWALNNNSNSVFFRILRRIVHADIRDKRHLFIGTRINQK